VVLCSNILITETKTKTRMIDFSFTETKTNAVGDPEELKKKKM